MEILSSTEEKIIEVEITPAGKNPSTLKAKPIGKNQSPMKIFWSQQYPDAYNTMLKTKKLTGTKWKVVLSKDWTGRRAYLATSIIH